MFGGLGDLAGLFKQAKQIQAKMAEFQKEQAQARYEGEAGAGLVKAVVDGRGMLIDVRINPDAVKDVELLEDLIKAAVGQAVQRSTDDTKARLAGVTGGLQNIPGLTEMLGGTG